MGTKPYACPVCKGKTNVKKGFYSDEPERTKCKACLNGIIWGVEDSYLWTLPDKPVEPNYYQWPTYLIQCLVCGIWYSGAHSCIGKWTVTGPGSSYTAPPTSSNPPSYSEVGQVFGDGYLHPRTVSEDE